MVKLVHGGDIYSARERIQGTILDFSANINPLGLPDSVKSALMERMEDFALYPDPLCRELVQKIAESEQIAPEHILCANGAAELIFRLVQAIRPRCALVVAPTFAEYEQALNGCSCRIEYHLLKEEQDFVLDDSVLERYIRTPASSFCATQTTRPDSWSTKSCWSGFWSAAPPVAHCWWWMNVSATFWRTATATA